MQCPRLKHFRRIMPSGQVGVCGHMTNSQQFSSMDELESSEWLQQLVTKFESNSWPAECIRCQNTEQTTNSSVRLDAIKRHKILSEIRSDYLIVGGVLDNLCNSACQFCNSTLSTKIGSLYDKHQYMISNNSAKFAEFPQDRIVQLDINGGEPTYSKNYQQLIADPPINLKFLRVNTNGSRPLPNLETLLNRGIYVTITMSFDGTTSVHDYVRWPITWDRFNRTLDEYLKIRERYSTLTIDSWTTLNALNLSDLPNIIDHAQKLNIGWSYGILESPVELNIGYRNSLTTAAKKHLDASKLPVVQQLLNMVAVGDDNQTALKKYIDFQDQLRGISYKDYI